MRMGQQVNALIWIWGEALRALRRGVGLLPFGIYALVQTAVVLAVASFAYPPFSLLVAPLLRWRFGAVALHYPNNYFVLRPALGQADTFLAVVLGSVLTASAVFLFARFFDGRRARFAAGWRAGASRYFPIVATSAILMVATQCASRVPFWFWSRLAEDAPKRFWLLRFASILVVVGLQALFVFVVPYLVVRGRSFLSAIGRGVVLSLKNPLTAYFAVAVPAALEVFPFWLSKKSAIIAYKLTPELLLAVVMVWIVIIAFSAYVTAASATRFFVHVTQEEATVPPRTEG
jgi:hypothetical protein